MNPVVHFEMPYEDRNRMADFYSKAFGWKPQMLGPEMGDYVVVRPSAISFNAKDDKWHATMNVNAAQLKAAPEYKYFSKP